METSNNRKLTFSVLVEKRNGAFVGHCIETGLVATALDESDVLSKMGKLLERQILFALENDRLRDIYHPAPQEVVSKFQKMEERMILQTRRSLSPTEHGVAKPYFTFEQNSYAAAVC